MDNYIKLCAEMAYNDVLMESYFEEELSLNEADKGIFKEKINLFFENIKKFIRTIFNKVITFIQDCIKKVKEKISKKKDNKTKNESASLYNNLMEMVIKEDSEYGEDIMKFYTNSKDYIDSNCKKAISLYSRTTEQLSAMSKEYIASIKGLTNLPKIDEFRAKLDRDTQNTVDNFKLGIGNITIGDIERSSKKIGNKENENDSISSKVLNVLIDTLNKSKKELEFNISIIEDNKKHFDNIFKTSWNSEYGKTDDIQYGIQTEARAIKEISTEYIKFLNKAESAYVKMINILVKFA